MGAFVICRLIEIKIGPSGLCDEVFNLRFVQACGTGKEAGLDQSSERMSVNIITVIIA